MTLENNRSRIKRQIWVIIDTSLYAHIVKNYWKYIMHTQALAEVIYGPVYIVPYLFPYLVFFTIRMLILFTIEK